MSSKYSAGRVWSQQYRGLGLEVCHWGVSDSNPDGTWCAYLKLDSKHNPEILELLGTLKTYGASPGRTYAQAHPWFDTLSWHHGLTFYQECTLTTGEVCIKLGCDFAHLWDEDYRSQYTEGYVMQELEQVADMYRAKYPRVVPSGN